MMTFFRRFSLTVGGSLLLVAGGSAAVLATDSTNKTADNSAANNAATNQTTKPTANNTTTNSDAQKTAAEKARLEAAKDKLQGDHLKACQDRQADINTHIGRLSARLQEHYDLYTRVAGNVKAFYIKKGLSISNYTALVADIDAKAAAAQSAINTVKSSSVSFDCKGDNPKGALQQIKANVGAAETALKNYRLSIKNLITAIKAALPKTTTSTGASQ